MKKQVILLVILIFPTLVTASNFKNLESEYRFLQLESKKDISHLIINDLIEDSEGYIWIATSNGLNRYNGQDNFVYKPDENVPGSINDSVINTLAVDINGVLLVGTDKGINIYNSQYDIFENFEFKNQYRKGIQNAKILKLFIDTKNRIWVTTKKNGLFLISTDRQSVLKAETNYLDTKPIFVYNIIQANNNKVLVSTKNGLLKYNESGKKLERITLNNKNLIVNAKAMFYTEEKGLLFSTANGLFEYSFSTKKKISLHPNIFKNKDISIIKQFNKDKVLIGTFQSGLYLLNLKNDNIQQFTNSISNKYSISNNQINSILHTTNNEFWIGTSLGINILSAEQLFFGHILSNKDFDQCLSGNTIYAMIHTRNNTLWIASFGHAINRINLSTGKCSKYETYQYKGSTYSLKNITSIYEDRYGDIWFASFNNGLSKFSNLDEKFIYLDLNQKLKFNRDLFSVTSIQDDNNGNILLATLYSGIFKYHKISGDITNIEIQNIKNGETENIFIRDTVFHNNSYWIATKSHGLWSYNFNTKDYHRYTSTIIPDSLYKLFIDSNDNLWISTLGEGVFKLNIKTGSIINYSTKNKLLSDHVLNIQEDNQKNIWLFTDKGLSRLKNNNQEVTTFLMDDGMQSDAFTTAGFFEKKSGTLWTGGINGFNHFKPKNIKDLNSTKDIIITNFELFYKNIYPYSKNSPLKYPISKTSSITLDYTQNVFAFNFNAMEFVHPDRILYKFKLDGYDKLWNEVNSKRRYANYTNISPGTYHFRVQSTNSRGVWSNNETSLKIIITPPWWETKIAYFSYVSFFIFSLYLLILYRTKSLTHKAELLQRSIDERTQELLSEKNKVENLLLLKNEEFANISHEFRTPLTLILGPITEMLKTKRDIFEIDRLKIAKRNGYRLLRMVDQLLHLETFKIKSITNLSIQPIGLIIRLISESFFDIAKDKNINLSIGHIDDISFQFTSDALDKIIVNLLSNSIKYTNSFGNINVSTQIINKNKFFISISDTGIGIPNDKIDFIFDRYTRVLDENSEQITGAGIGLSLVKNLVESHGGSIKVESKLGHGSKFIIYLPIINKSNTKTIISSSHDKIVAMEIQSLTQQNYSLKYPIHDNLPVNSKKPFVLVIEDNKDMLFYITESIASNFRCITATNGLEGYNLAKEQVPDIIICDLMMPILDGYQTTQKIRSDKITNHIPIILLTARGDKESRLKGWKEKADEYITKPFDVEELIVRINNILEIRKILKRRFTSIAFNNSDKNNKMDNFSITEKRNLRFINQLNDVVKKLYVNPKTSINNIASQLAMSERQLFRKLKGVVDITPSDYLRRFRLERAREVLAQGHSANYTAFEVGFSSQSYFGKCFKTQYGLTPSEFVANIDNKNV